MLKDYETQMKEIKKELNLLCLCTETLERQDTDREKISASHTSDRRIISTIYKKFS